MKYTSTRNSAVSVSGAEAIVKGISQDGGLFVPCEFPQISKQDVYSMIEMSYPERVAFILNKFFDELGYDSLLEYATAAYNKFDGDPCPLVALEDDMFLLELWHGPTCAFKDMALSLMPYLMQASKAQLGIKEDTLILVATSGDTGKAALEGYRDVPGVHVMVFYPVQGVSDMQKLQMMTQEGDNVYVSAIDGNFDDAQTGVKAIFANAEVKQYLAQRGYALSSANSINWGRLAPQICYYFSAYCDILSTADIQNGDKVNFVVPTGNFGNILAGYYAKQMGLPVGKLICASNQNNILTDFFNDGVYDVQRSFYKSMSPSMDILISSNLERLLYEASGRNDAFIRERYAQLAKDGAFSVDESMKKQLSRTFLAGFATEQETIDTIEGFYEEFDYVLDPHTSVAVSVFYDYSIETKDKTPSVIVSTASPYKFPCDVYNSIAKSNLDDPFKAAKKLAFYADEMPDAIRDLTKKPVIFDGVCDIEDMALLVEKVADEVFTPSNK